MLSCLFVWLVDCERLLSLWLVYFVVHVCVLGFPVCVNRKCVFDGLFGLRLSCLVVCAFSWLFVCVFIVCSIGGLSVLVCVFDRLPVGSVDFRCVGLLHRVNMCLGFSCLSCIVVSMFT